MPRWRCVLIAQPVLAKPVGRAPQPAPPAPAVLSDEQILKNVHLDTRGSALLEFFRQRVKPSVDADELARLTAQLSDPSEAVPTKAAAKLIGLGPLAAPALRRTVNQADNEDIVSRARTCLQAIEGNNGIAVAQAAVRLLAAPRPEGTTEALINYLPFADDDTVVQEIETALLAVGLRDGQPDAALLGAERWRAHPPQPCRAGGVPDRQQRRTLGGASVTERCQAECAMQAALSLTDAHEAEAMPVLINLRRRAAARRTKTSRGISRRVSRGMGGADAARRR